MVVPMVILTFYKVILYLVLTHMLQKYDLMVFVQTTQNHIHHIYFGIHYADETMLYPIQ